MKNNSVSKAPEPHAENDARTNQRIHQSPPVRTLASRGVVLFEESLLGCAGMLHSTPRKATTSLFSSALILVPRIRLKNSTVSSSVSNLPSWRYGGESLIPRKGNVLIGPSAPAIRPLIILALKNRSVCRLCMVLSV